MRKISFLFLVSASLFAFCTSSVNAQVINKFGIHLAVPSDQDIERAAELVNSTGGDWGYITLVIQQNDRDRDKWTNVFNKLRKLHLIPIIRLATDPEGENWKKAKKEDAESWALFLNSLPWVVKNRYVILFNETNHANEWGGEVSAKEYGEVAREFASQLKQHNSDYFIMLAGLDLAAPNEIPIHQEAQAYLQEAFTTFCPEVVGCDGYIDGIASHSYPNPGFAGSPFDFGKNTIRGYEHEINWYRSLFRKDFPVYITETGWDSHKVGTLTSAQNLIFSYQNLWLSDPRVWAVTPFVLNYQAAPFLGFSFIAPGGETFYPSFQLVKSLSKTAGEPEIIETGSLQFDLPQDLLVNSEYTFEVNIKNTGQGLWTDSQGYTLQLKNLQGADFYHEHLGEIEPGRDKKIFIGLKTKSAANMQNVQLVLKKKDKVILESTSQSLSILPEIEMKVEVGLLPKLIASGNDFEVQIYDSKENMVFKKKKVSILDGEGVLSEVQNVALGEKYRVVILKPFYLPRQSFITFSRGENKLTFKTMYPFDTNSDGNLSFGDVLGVFTNVSAAARLIP